jgi:formate hydrogenlyase subunit 6
MKKPGKMMPFLFKMLFKKPATVFYPFVNVEMPQDFRGKLEFDASKCIGCKICMRDCPADAIVIEKVGEKEFTADVYLDRCIYCGQCVDSCPKKALRNTKNYELANYTRNVLKVKI